MMRPGQPQLLRKHAVLTNDMFVWRTVGAAVWSHAMLLVAHLACSLALVPVTRSSPLRLLGWRGLLLHALQMGVLMAQRAVMSASEAAPPQLPKLPMINGSWIGPLLSRLLLRDRKLTSVTAVAWLFGSTAACAVAYAYLHPSLASHATTLRWSVIYGCAIAAAYSLQHLARCRDVLSYPTLHRHRYFQARARLPQEAVSAVKLAAAGLVVAALACKGCVAGPQVLLSTLVSASVCTFGWLLSHLMLNIVFAERLRLLQQTEAPFQALVSYGLSSNDAMVQDLTLMDLASVVEDSSSAAAGARQAIAFADETGRLGWTPLGTFLVGELRDLTTQLAASLPGEGTGAAGAAPAAVGASGRSSAQWNTMSPASSRAADNRRAQDLAAWALRSRFHRDGWCLRALSAMAAACRSEDRYGVLLLCDPNLADVMLTLASLTLVLQQYGKAQSTLTGSASKVGQAVATVADALLPSAHTTTRKVEELAYALEDLTRSCMYRIVLAFGPSLKAALKDSKQKPAFGSLAEATGLLQAMLELTE